MNNNQLTKERLQEIAEDGFLKHGESKELARMALAEKASEPEYLPLDYLQGQKDGLEWASQLAEANHPETGDWLYDDPIELAKAIRKGPDMPPVQPVADSEPVAYIFKHPAGRLFWALTDESNKGQNDVMPVYAIPQPAPVVPDELLKEYLRLVQCMLSDYRDGNYGNAQRWIRHIAKASDDFERKHGISPWEMARKTCRAAMLNGGKP